MTPRLRNLFAPKALVGWGLGGALLYASTTHVPEHHVGVATFDWVSHWNNTEGKVLDPARSLQPGLHLKWPWTSYVDVPERTTISFSEGTDVGTKDGELVYFSYNAMLSLTPEHVVYCINHDGPHSMRSNLLEICHDLTYSEIAADPQKILDRACVMHSSFLGSGNTLTAHLTPPALPGDPTQAPQKEFSGFQLATHWDTETFSHGMRITRVEPPVPGIR